MNIKNLSSPPEEAAYAGQVIEDGDGGKMVIRRTAGQTAGELYEFDWYLHAGHPMDPPHYHPTQEEQFEVVAGTPKIMLNGKSITLRPGERLVVPAGAYHAIGNPATETVHVVTTFRPAMDIHTYFVQAFDIFRTSWGLTRLARLARLVRRNPEYVGFSRPMQLVMAMLAALPHGRKRGGVS